MSHRKPGMPSVSWLFWLFHPIQAYWITFLIREAFRYKEDSSKPQARTWGEETLYTRVQAAIDTAVAKTIEKVNTLAAKQQAHLRTAQHERELAELERERLHTPKTRVKAIVAGPVTAQTAKQIIDEQQKKIAKETEHGETRHLDRPSKPRRTFAYLMITVDIAAIFNVFATLFNIDMAAPDPQDLVATSGFAIIAAGVLGLLAHSTGHLVWEWRATEAPPTSGPPEPDGLAPTRSGFPPRKAMLTAKMLALFVVSTLSGISILTRILEEAMKIGNPVLGWVLGILVCMAAVVAPWLVVLDEMRSGSIEVRTIEALTRLTQDAHDAVVAHRRAAARHDKTADALYRDAETLELNQKRANIKNAVLVRKITAKARSLHARSGRFALVTGGDPAYPSAVPATLVNTLEIDTSKVQEAVQRMRKAEQPTPPRPLHPVKDTA
jgi:hypothetical protein